MTIVRVLILFAVTFVGLTLSSCQPKGTSLRIGVASNFLNTAEKLAKEFEANRDFPKIELVVSSSGKLAAQILNGGRIDVFFSADEKNAEKISEKAVDSTPYAYGQLVFFNPGGDTDWETAQTTLRSVAIANPDLAPYGKAAKDVIGKSGVAVVFGENVGQAYQMVRSRAADAGFVALSQVIADSGVNKSDYKLVSETAYTPIKQVAVLLNMSPDARNFFEFARSEKGQKIIRDSGYRIPDER